MSCGCKNKKNKSKEPQVKVSVNKKSRLGLGGNLLKALRTFFLYIVLTLAVPVIWVLLLVIVTKSYYGEPLDLAKTLTRLFNKKDKDNFKEEEIVPDDYELVGVDKVG